MTPSAPARQDLLQRLHDVITSWSPRTTDARPSAARFDELARQVFAYQRAHVPAYGRFCAGRGIDTIDSYLDIPAVPTDVFKLVRLSTSAPTVRTFLTSGTTQGARGAHHFSTLQLYAAALHAPFQHYCNPHNQQLRMLILAPSPEDAPESSLSYMLGELMMRWGDASSAFFVGRGTPSDDSMTLHTQALTDALTLAEREQAVTMVLGTGFGFVECFERMETSVRLAPGSRVMETGGFKGRTREIGRAQLYDLFTARLGIPRAMCVSEYSMTELSSQAYTGHIHSTLSGHTLDDPAPGSGLWTPPWARVDLVDPRTFKPVADGAVGLVRWTDLANMESVCAVLTSDLGRRHPSGALMLLGRAPDSELRGCGLTIEEIVDTTQ